MPESVEAAPADDEWHRPVHSSNVLTIVLLLDDKFRYNGLVANHFSEPRT
jgi:hypothetical protein